MSGKLFISGYEFQLAKCSRRLKLSTTIKKIGYRQVKTPGTEGILQRWNKASAKGLYGLKQAPRWWNETFHSFLSSYGLERSEADHSVYYSNIDAKSHHTSIVWWRWTALPFLTGKNEQNYSRNEQEFRPKNRWSILLHSFRTYKR
jgi:hypothetical protein